MRGYIPIISPPCLIPYLPSQAAGTWSWQTLQPSTDHVTWPELHWQHLAWGTEALRIYLSICLSVYLSIYLSIYQSIYLSYLILSYLCVCVCMTIIYSDLDYIHFYEVIYIFYIVWYQVVCSLVSSA